MKKHLFTIFLVLLTNIGTIFAEYTVVSFSDVANYIDFEALSVYDPNMEKATITSTTPYMLANGSVLKGFKNSDGSEANNSWHHRGGNDSVMPTPDWDGVDFLTAPMIFRAASGISIELGAFKTSEDGELVVYFQPFGDKDRGVEVSVKGNVIGTCLKSGVKIDGVRPAYKAEFDLPAGNYAAGDVVIKVAVNTINILGVSISSLFELNTTGGICGKDKALSWIYDPYSATLTISGSGELTEKYTFNVLTKIVKTLILNDGITAIGNNAFYSCSALTSLAIPNSVTSIANQAFYKCNSLTDIYATCGDLERAKQLFNNDDRVKYKPLPYTITVNATNGNASFPQHVCDALELTATPDYGYHFTQWSDGNTDNPRTILLTQDTTFTAEFSVSTSGQCGDNLNWLLSDDVLTITGSGDMWNEQPWIISRSAIKQVNFPQGITSIGDSAFLNCANLTSIEIPNSVTSIGKDAFSYCTGLTAVTIPENVQSTGAYPFYGCENIKSVVWNAVNCTTYDDGKYVYPPFQGSENITSFTIGEKVETLPRGLCYGMLISEILIPNSVIDIGDYAFFGCSGLTSVSVPNNVTIIGKEAFSNCTVMSSLTIGNSVMHIRKGAFKGCSSLTSVVWAAKRYSYISSYDAGPFYDIRKQISSFEFSNSVEYIPPYLCYEMTLLTSIIIPKGCISIGDYAFQGCANILSISLPSTLTTIGTFAFDTQKIMKVYNYSVTPQDMSSYSGYEYIFRGILTNTKLYVPEQSIETYSNTYFWCYFGSILPLETTEPTAIGDVYYDDSSSSNSSTNKVIHNGQIFILRGDKVYTIDGRLVH